MSKAVSGLPIVERSGSIVPGLHRVDDWSGRVGGSHPNLRSQNLSRTDELLIPEIITGNHRTALKFRGKAHLYEVYGNY